MFAPFDINNLKTSLAAAFPSAVADRFGWWEPFGQGSWGSMGAFAGYTHELVPFASGYLLTVIVWAATATEATLGVLLLTGWRPKLVGAATCSALIVFGTAMAVSLVWDQRLATVSSPQQAQPRPTRYSVGQVEPRSGSTTSTSSTTSTQARN